MVESLLNAGADPDAKTEGEVARGFFAVGGDTEELVALLERATGGGESRRSQ